MSLLTDEPPLRGLQEVQSDVVDSAPSAAPGVSDDQKFRDTFILYGSIIIAMFLIFCWARQKYPRPFTVRHWLEKIQSPLADPQGGFFSWAWRVYKTKDDDFLQYNGLDALCYVRVLTMGLKIAGVGMFNSIWLMPIYATSNADDNTRDITDSMVEVTIAHVPAGNGRLVATTIASYILFGYTMYLILEEFKWFTDIRIKFATKPQPRNYTVFCRNIPEQYRSRAALEAFFQRSVPGDRVLQATICVQTAKVAQKVTKRNLMVANLEHVVLVEEVTGTRPRNKHPKEKKMVDSIEYYTQEIQTMNMDIEKRIQNIEMRREAPAGETDSRPLNPSLHDSEDEKPTKMKLSNDGIPLGSAFVSFKTLNATSTVLQSIQSRTPFDMEILEAPAPEDVFWPSVGRTHKDLQVGNLIARTLTVTICLLWTIPMTFVASLSSIEGLRAQLDFIDDLLDSVPFLVPVFEQLAPLLVVVFNALLPVILTFVTMFEGPIGGSFLARGLFVKLAAFMIIQTFFVSALSGGIMKELDRLIDSPTDIIPILAESLPTQSTYFMQIVFVSTVIGGIMESLRIVPLVMALLRKCLGPRLNEKEKQTAFMGIRPLADPAEFVHASALASTVLFFMVLLVYVVIAPVLAFVLGFCFLYQGAIYRYQFNFIYPSTPDSGGKLFLSFIRIMMTCMVVAEIVIVGLLGIKEASIAAPLMIPLIVITILFTGYVKQQHFRVCENLPLGECCEVDDSNSVDFDLSFLENKYVQPAIQEKIVIPNISEDKLLNLGFVTPVEAIEEEDKVGA